MLANVVDAGLALLALPSLGVSLYLLALAVLSRRAALPRYGRPRLRFDLVVPAHDEERGIARTVQSLAAVDYPRELRRVIVVADNCRDATVERARAAGAMVLVRSDLAHVGKGHALQFAFDACLEDAFADAVVVVDADTVVSPNLLRAFAARLEAGAQAVQAHYGVQNPQESWRTRLMTIAFCLFHKVRSLARERLRVSAGLRGNGMCFSRALLVEVPHAAASLVEDVEYGILVGEAGHRVHYAAEAEVLGEMVSSERGSRSQRRRWEDGRREVRARYARDLLRRAFAGHDRVALDLALDLLVPPLSFLAGSAAAGLAAGAIASCAAGCLLVSATLWAVSAGCLLVYVARGWWLSGTGLHGLLDLLCAPAYVAWKLALKLRPPDADRGAWVRTARRGEVRP